MNYLHTRTYMIGRSGNKTATSAAAYRTGSVVAASAYRANDKIIDIKSGKIHDYTRKKGVVFSKIFLPQKAPHNFTDRSKLWNTVEKVENRKNSQFARQWEAALPKEFSRSDQLDLLSKFVEDYFVSQGMIADAALHDKGDGNPHVHILLTLRRVDENGFVGNKERLWNDRKLAGLWRNAWAERCNEIYKKMDLPARIDPRSYEIQNNGLTPTKPIGKVNSRLEKRGILTKAGNENRKIEAENKKIIGQKLYDLTSGVAAMAEKSELEKQAADMVQEHSPNLETNVVFDEPSQEGLGKKILQATEKVMSAVDQGIVQPVQKQVVEPLIERTLDPLADDVATQFGGDPREVNFSEMSLPEIVERLQQIRGENKDLESLGRLFAGFDTKISDLQYQKDNLTVSQLGNSRWLDNQIRAVEISRGQAQISLQRDHGLRPDQIDNKVEYNQTVLDKLTEIQADLKRQKAMEAPTKQKDLEKEKTLYQSPEESRDYEMDLDY